MSAPWACPRCYELGRTPVRLVIARTDDPLNHTEASVCLRCADVLWHRLRKVLRPLVRPAESVPGGNDAEEPGHNPWPQRALPVE